MLLQLVESHRLTQVEEKVLTTESTERREDFYPQIMQINADFYGCF